MIGRTDRQTNGRAGGRTDWSLIIRRLQSGAFKSFAHYSLTIRRLTCFYTIWEIKKQLEHTIKCTSTCLSFCYHFQSKNKEQNTFFVASFGPTRTRVMVFSAMLATFILAWSTNGNFVLFKWMITAHSKRKL